MKRIDVDRIVSKFLNERNIPYRVYYHRDRGDFKYRCVEYFLYKETHRGRRVSIKYEEFSTEEDLLTFIKGLIHTFESIDKFNHDAI